jgi:hypothetical protein
MLSEVWDGRTFVRVGPDAGSRFTIRSDPHATRWWWRWRRNAPSGLGGPSSAITVVGVPTDLREALDIAERAVDLQAEASRLLRACASDDPKTGRLARDLGEIAAQYYELWRRSESPTIPGEVRRPLYTLLHYHYQILREALALVLAPPTQRIDVVRHKLAAGLGDPALDLGLLRNRLRSTVAAS